MALVSQKGLRMQIGKLAEICNSNEVAFKIFLDSSEFKGMVERGVQGKDCINDGYIEQVIRAYAKDRASKTGQDTAEMLYSFDLAATGIPFNDIDFARFAIVTSGFSFDGFNITEYTGFISKDVVFDLGTLDSPDDEGYFDKACRVLGELKATARDRPICEAQLPRFPL